MLKRKGYPGCRSSAASAASATAAPAAGGATAPPLVSGAMVGVLRVELHLPHARSLKEKRAALRPVIDAARRRYRVAIAEVDHQELHQRAALEVAVVASAGHVVSGVLDSVERLVWSAGELEVLETRRSFLEED